MGSAMVLLDRALLSSYRSYRLSIVIIPLANSLATILTGGSDSQISPSSGGPGFCPIQCYLGPTIWHLIPSNGFTSSVRECDRRIYGRTDHIHATVTSVANKLTSQHCRRN